MSAPDSNSVRETPGHSVTSAPDWDRVAEALERWGENVNINDRIWDMGHVWSAARWALAHGPALEAAREVEIECSTCEGGGEVYNHGENADCDLCADPNGFWPEYQAHIIDCPTCEGTGEVEVIEKKRLLPQIGEGE